MIEFISGKVERLRPAYVIIDVNGLGYKVQIPLSTFDKIGQKKEVKLHTHFVVREDAQLLYGFSTESERTMFQMLISVSGVGPNTGLTVLSALGPEELRQSILSEDVQTMKSIKGIGAKTAQRIIVDLKDKVAGEELNFDIFASPNNTVKIEALSALRTLGFEQKKAGQVIDQILKESKEPLGVEDVIKKSLKSL